MCRVAFDEVRNLTDSMIFSDTSSNSRMGVVKSGSWRILMELPRRYSQVSTGRSPTLDGNDVNKLLFRLRVRMLGGSDVEGIS